MGTRAAGGRGGGGVYVGDGVFPPGGGVEEGGPCVILMGVDGGV